MIFSTSRLICRPIQLDDIIQYFSIFGAEDSAEYDEFEPINLADAKSDVEEIINKPKDSDELELAVCEINSTLMIGVLYAKLEEKTAYIGYHFDGVARGKGFASEAVSGFVSYLTSIHFTKISAKVDSENARSIKLLERIGFSKDESYSEQQFFKGKDRIELLYSLES